LDFISLNRLNLVDATETNKMDVKKILLVQHML